MKAKSLKGRSPEEIKNALARCISDGFTPTLAIVFLSVKQNREKICNILDEQKIAIYGATTHGEFIDEELGKETIAILLLDIDRSYFSILFDEYPDKNYREITRVMAQKALGLFKNPAFLIAQEFQEGIAVVNASKDYTVNRYGLIDKNGRCAAEGYREFEKPYDKSGLSETEKTIISVKAPLKWDAEHPNLYTLKTTLTAEGAVKEVCSQRIGLREITYGGAKGTDSNKVYVNGKEIKLRGVCRHDVSYKTGRSTSREEDYAEILDYKKCNINFIRTSHYPVSKHLLDACDEFGVYVEEENAACWGPVNCPSEQYLNGFKELVERDRNRACI
jgi:hypothetical protein